MKQVRRQKAIYERAFARIEQAGIEGYDSFNEARRDGAFLDQAIAFAVSHPLLLGEVTLYKALSFVGGSLGRAIFSLLALFGVLAWRRQRPAFALALMVAAYSAPHILAAPFYYRYRYPIEPIVLVLLGAALAALGRAVAKWILARSLLPAA